MSSRAAPTNEIELKLSVVKTNLLEPDDCAFLQYFQCVEVGVRVSMLVLCEAHATEGACSERLAALEVFDGERLVSQVEGWGGHLAVVLSAAVVGSASRFCAHADYFRC